MVRTISTVRTVFACSLLILIAAATGCRMCASPYDYCGPTSTDDCGQGCSQGGGQEIYPDVRRGSILSQGVQTMAPPIQPIVGMEPTPATPMQFDLVEEAEQTAERKPPAEPSVDKLDLALWNPLAGH